MLAQGIAISVVYLNKNNRSIPCPFYEILVSYIFENLYHRANLRPNLRQIARFALEIERFVCDRATSIENEKLRSEGVAMYAYSVSVYYA